jgi:hypothetical protein
MVTDQKAAIIKPPFLLARGCSVIGDTLTPALSLRAMELPFPWSGSSKIRTRDCAFFCHAERSRSTSRFVLQNRHGKI